MSDVNLTTFLGNRRWNLISHLDGYCVQEDFDSINSSLPRSLQSQFLPHLVATYLFKDCVDRFFTNPFWYVVPRPGIKEGDGEAACFGTQLYELYQNILATNAKDAHLWRLWTTRFCHPATVFGVEMISHRISTVKSICKDVLKQELLQSLLSDPDISAASHGLSWLHRIYNDFAEISVKMSAYLSYVHLDGHRVLVIEHPAVYICGGRKDPNERRLQKKAVVYVEDRDGSSSS
ncbi:hypothetical protein BO78DRAFT_438756 [Aspergillus sclerotiicarbonarius CBS 121057]|uniref:Uncharacterized protein n=1 Tax=Aspergillus sclerotiicarbonarius (strain CBS 121057 / IBT 28362) TaxID=1448318 RepID=A0A319FLA8_ASPSB|nr:hypothetical protein BO78DRAFT_438756 [Aspergillus sclerotiicarbonarius CBS 121057]